MNKARCPMCSEDTTVPKQAKLGTPVVCEHCEAELEVVSLKPLELDWPLEDLDSDDEFDDFDLDEEDEDDEFPDLDDEDDVEDFEDDDDEDDEY